ncbi:MAG: glutathione S-transferase family protein, partial [Proteobacteria bacterium]|nr:glutathione S-transferase family protein [Pseudomonadota bacterium]
LITEVGAICFYLADAFPKAGLAPAVGDSLRGPYVRWMFFQGNCFEPALIDKALKREPGSQAMMPYGNLDTTVETVAKAVAKGPWFLGDKFTALDVYFGSAIRWTTMFGILPERPEFKSYIARLTERPALKRAMAKDAELEAKSTG